MPLESRLLLGRDHTRWNGFDLITTGHGRTAAATSVGGAYVRRSKQGAEFPNEDCAVVVEQDARTLLAVLDGHTGWRASHVAAAILGERAPPATLEDLLQAVQGGAFSADEPSGDCSATTMILAVLDRDAGRAFGLSFGDSSAVRIHERAEPLADKLDDYLVPWGRMELADDELRSFSTTMRPGDDLVLFSDGVDECHRHHPETSVTVADLAAVRSEMGATPASFCAGIVQLALAGVRGHPGGEDNVTVVVSRA